MVHNVLPPNAAALRYSNLYKNQFLNLYFLEALPKPKLNLTAEIFIID